MTRMNIGNIPQALDRAENNATRVAADFARLVQDIRHGCGRDTRGLRNFANGYSHGFAAPIRRKTPGISAWAESAAPWNWGTARSVNQKKNLDNAARTVIFPPH